MRCRRRTDARYQLTCLLLNLVCGSGGAASVIEPPFAELCAQLAPLPAVFVARFTSRLMEIKQPDDIWEELKSLHKLVQLNASRPDHGNDSGIAESANPAQIASSHRVHTAFPRAPAVPSGSQLPSGELRAALSLQTRNAGPDLALRAAAKRAVFTFAVFTFRHTQLQRPPRVARPNV